MRDGLGYSRFGARGGDIGSGVTAWLAVDHPDLVAGIHVSDVVRRPSFGPGSPPLTAAERRFLDEESAALRRILLAGRTGLEGPDSANAQSLDSVALGDDQCRGSEFLRRQP